MDLEQRVRELEDRVQELEDLIGMPRQTTIRPVGLLPRSWQMAGLLAANRVVTRDFAIRVMLGSNSDAGERLVDACVCRLRRFMRAHHKIRIVTQYKDGYYVHEADRARLQQLVGQC